MPDSLRTWVTLEEMGLWPTKDAAARIGLSFRAFSDRAVHRKIGPAAVYIVQRKYQLWDQKAIDVVAAPTRPNRTNPSREKRDTSWRSHH
jgi:hypothetical protein